MRKALTNALVRNIAPPTAGRIEVSDLPEAGLSFYVAAKGAWSWCFRFRDPQSGKTRPAQTRSVCRTQLSDGRFNRFAAASQPD
jgi:hypothetical protein